jgi:hypothetical protein
MHSPRNPDRYIREIVPGVPDSDANILGFSQGIKSLDYSRRLPAKVAGESCGADRDGSD